MTPNQISIDTLTARRRGREGEKEKLFCRYVYSLLIEK